ncbi:MAG: YciI family protein [Rhizobiaceae bacterium]
MAYFHLRLQPPRPTFPFDGTPEEMAAMARHADYWRAQAKAGTAIAVGPVFEGEGAWGMAVIEVADDAAAREIADSDPILQASFGFRFIVSPVRSLIMREPQTNAE